MTSRQNERDRNNACISRRSFVARAVACGAGILSMQGLTPNSSAAETPPGTPLHPKSSMPVVYWTGPREATLSWPAAASSQGWVEYGPTPKLGDKAMTGEDVADYLGGFTSNAVREAAIRPALDPDALRVRLKGMAPGECIY
jgi:hypothetical protein